MNLENYLEISGGTITKPPIRFGRKRQRINELNEDVTNNNKTIVNNLLVTHTAQWYQ